MTEAQQKSARPGLTIRRKLLRVSLPLVALSTVLLLSLQLYRSYETIQQEIHARLGWLLANEATVLAGPVWNYEINTLQQVADSLDQMPDVHSVAIFDRDGHSLAHAGEIHSSRLDSAPLYQPELRGLRKLTLRRIAHLILPGIDDTSRRSAVDENLDLRSAQLGIMLPTDAGPIEVGRLVIAMDSEQRMHEEIGSLAELVGFGLLISTSALLVVLLTVSVVVERPLRRFAAAVAASDRDGNRYTFAWESRDEIGHLVRRFNEMQASFTTYDRELLESRRHFELLAANRERTIETAHAPILAVDRFAHITIWNGRAVELTACPADEAMGCDLVREFVTPEQQAAVTHALEQALAGTVVEELEIRLAGRRETMPLLLLNIAPQYDADGRVTGAVGIGQDITERARHEAEREHVYGLLRDEQHRTTDLLEHATAAIWTTSLDGVLMSSNAACRRWFATGDGEPGTAAADCLLPGVLAAVEPLAVRVADEDRPTEVELSLARRDGSEMVALVTVSPIHDRAGRVVATGQLVQDVTELVRSRDAVLQSAKMARMAEMSTMVAHEINQPLHVIRLASSGVLRHLERGGVEPDYLRTKMVRIGDQVVRAAGIVDHMRKFGGDTERERERVEPEAVFGHALSLCETRLRHAGIRVERDAGDLPLWVEIAPTEFETVFLNLISNSIAALSGRADGVLRYSQTAEGDTVVISVDDDGIGIPPSVLDHVFEPFFTTREVGQGQGLGLAVAHAIVTQSGGTIGAENLAAGTRITIRLPRVEAPPEGEAG